MTWVLDLDGVVWLGDQRIPGADEAVARLRETGEQVLFATNNSYEVVASQEAKLARMGIPAEGDVVTSALAAATLVEPGERVLACGGPGVSEAVAARGAEPVDPERARDGAGPIDVVMVGFHREFDYERMRVAHAAIRAGARFVATNADATYPTASGPIPGGGSIAAAIAYASGVQPVVAGKPHQPMADFITARGGPEGIMVGDRPDSDGLFAGTLGYRWGLVLSGVTHAEDLPTLEPRPDLVAADLLALVVAERGG